MPLPAAWGEYSARSRPCNPNTFLRRNSDDGNSGVSGPDLLHFKLDGEENLLFPDRCTLSVSCYDAPEERQAIAEVLEQVLADSVRLGLDLRALDGITFAHDWKAAAAAIQSIPENHIPLEMDEVPESMELARTVPVWRDPEMRFHIFLRAGLGVMALSPEAEHRRVAYACVAHEAAHVDHDGHLWRTFPGIYGPHLDCGDRSRQAFLKAIDVWSEYAACRSTAPYRPEAIEDFEDSFCRALEGSLAASKDQIAAYRRDQKALPAFVGMQQLFGDLMIHAGYLMGHLAGIELDFERGAPRAAELLRERPSIKGIFLRLRRVLHELWLGEYGWKSIDVFAPIYDLICEMMALHGLVFARCDSEWRIVMCDEDFSVSDIQDALASLMNRQNA